MAISLKHLFQSAKTDGPDNTIVQPSDWNDEHVLTQATNRLLGRTTAGAGATEEIAPGTGITLSAGTLSADVTSVAGRTGAVTLSTADISGLTTGYVQKTSATGSAYLPAGTTGQREGSPAAGYIRYNTTTGKFEGYGSAWGNIGGGAAIGDTPPANPGAGDLWWNSADGRMYVYYTDANSSQWVDLSAGGAGQYLPLTGGTVSGNVAVTGETSTVSLKVNNVPILAGPAFSAYATSQQTVSGVTSTKIVFNAEEYDTHNCFDTTTYRFQPNIAGYYLIQGQTRFNNTTSYFWTELRKNGVLYRRSGEPAGGFMIQQQWSLLVYMNGSTDYIEAWHFNGNTSGTYTIGYNSPDTAFANWFQGHLVRAV
jgi:hypothetical protein